MYVSNPILGAEVSVRTSITIGHIAFLAGAALLATVVVGATWVGRVRRRNGIGLPDVHLSAACAVSSGPGVGIVGGGVPAFDVGLQYSRVAFLLAVK